MSPREDLSARNRVDEIFRFPDRRLAALSRARQSSHRRSSALQNAWRRYGFGGQPRRQRARDRPRRRERRACPPTPQRSCPRRRSFGEFHFMKFRSRVGSSHDLRADPPRSSGRLLRVRKQESGYSPRGDSRGRAPCRAVSPRGDSGGHAKPRYEHHFECLLDRGDAHRSQTSAATTRVQARDLEQVRRRGARQSATTDDARTAHPGGTPALALTINTVHFAKGPAIAEAGRGVAKLPAAIG